MDATVEQLGDVVIDALRAARYLESTIGQYEKTIRYLKGFVADHDGVYTLVGYPFHCRVTSKIMMCRRVVCTIQGRTRS